MTTLPLYIFFSDTPIFYIFTFENSVKKKYVYYFDTFGTINILIFHYTIFKEYVGVVMWHGAMPETIELNPGFLMFKVGMVKMAVAGSHIHCKHTMFKDFWSHYSILSISSFIMFLSLVLCMNDLFKFSRFFISIPVFQRSNSCHFRQVWATIPAPNISWSRSTWKCSGCFLERSKPPSWLMISSGTILPYRYSTWIDGWMDR